MDSIKKNNTLHSMFKFEGKDYTCLLSEPGSRAIIYRVVEIIAFFDSEQIFVYENVERSKAKIKRLEERPEGFWHGCKVSSPRGRREFVLEGPGIELLNADAKHEPSAKVIDALPKLAAVPSNGNTGLTPQRPYTPKENTPGDQKAKDRIVKKMIEQSAIALNMNKDLIWDTYNQAIDEHESDKKFKFPIGLKLSITGVDPDTYEVSADLSFSIKYTASYGDQVRVGDDMVDQMEKAARDGEVGTKI